MNKAWSALADPTRRQILEMLKKADMSAGEIAQRFNISKPSISHHLNILKNANLVESEKQGQAVIYSINTTVFQELMSFMAELMKIEDNEEENK